MAEEQQPEPPPIVETTSTVTRETATQTGPMVPTVWTKVVEHFIDLLLLGMTLLMVLALMLTVWLFPTNEKVFGVMSGLVTGFAGAFLVKLQAARRP